MPADQALIRLAPKNPNPESGYKTRFDGNFLFDCSFMSQPQSEAGFPFGLKMALQPENASQSIVFPINDLAVLKVLRSNRCEKSGGVPNELTCN